MDMDERQYPCFFLGANAPGGFYSCFESMYDPNSDWRCTILKGGPGSGKSTILKKTAERAQQSGKATEWIYCSSDPRSLDAVILPEDHLCMVDGTAPHVVEPQFPGACESLFNPGDCWNRDLLFAHRAEIRSLGRQIADCHRRSAATRSVIGTLQAEIRQIMQPLVRTDTLARYTDRLCKRVFRGKPNRPGSETTRFLSGFTPDGLLLLDQTLSCYAAHITLIEDPYRAAAPQILAALRNRALKSGCRVISCRSPICPEELDALILPEEQRAFAISGPLLRYRFSPEHTIHARRFLDSDMYAASRTRLRARTKTIRELIEESCTELRRALRLHDQLEQYYIDAMDYRKLNRMTDSMIERFLADLH